MSAEAASLPLTTTDESTHAAPDSNVIQPRMWPALVIILLQPIFSWGPSLIWPGSFAHFLGMFWTPIVCTVLLALWWLFASRVSWSNKFVGLGLAVGIAIAFQLLFHKSMQMGANIYALPTATTGAVLLLALSYQLSWSSRRWLGLAGLTIGYAVWTLVRVDGMDGALNAEFAYRWSPTEEEVFLEQVASQTPIEVPAKPVEKSDLVVVDGDWPGFRGPNRDGRLFGVTFDTDWKQNPPQLLWKQRIGPGWSSFAVVGDWVFTQEQRGDTEAVVAYDATTGKTRWVNELDERFEETVAGAGPRATPTFHDGMIFTMGGNGVVQCINAVSGKTIWQQDVRKDVEAKVPIWGFCSSPLIYQNLVIVIGTGETDQSTVAYNIADGKMQWAKGDAKHSYASPHLLSVDGQDQVLIASDLGLEAFDPTTGSVLWEHQWDIKGMARIVQPLVIQESDKNPQVLLGTGYGEGARLLELNRNDATWSAEAKWTTNRLKPYFNDLVLHHDHCYGFRQTDSLLRGCCHRRPQVEGWSLWIWPSASRRRPESAACTQRARGCCISQSIAGRLRRNCENGKSDSRKNLEPPCHRPRQAVYSQWRRSRLLPTSRKFQVVAALIKKQGEQPESN